MIVDMVPSVADRPVKATENYGHVITVYNVFSIKEKKSMKTIKRKMNLRFQNSRSLHDGTRFVFFSKSRNGALLSEEGVC